MNTKIENMITSMEVAEMIGKKHNELLKDIRRYIEQLNEGKIPHVEFFYESSYLDSKGQERPCFNVTKKGCEFIAHKLTGIKGTEFTARYINRFYEMEDMIGNRIAQKEKSNYSKKKNLSATNMLVKNIENIFSKAGVDPIYIAAETKRIYSNAGIEISIPLITDETMPTLYDCTEIAKELGILSKNGKPHNQAVSAIISELDISENEIVTTAFSRNGHDNVTVQYKPSVLDAVRRWLIENNYPDSILYIDKSGKKKTFSVMYMKIA